MKQKIQVNRIIKRTETEGFGRRYCIWVQGCSIHCPHCKNRHMWPFEGGKEMEIEEALRDIQLQPDIEGVTLLGGEPLDQKEAAAGILQGVQQMGLSTIVFTGYLYENLLKKADESLKKILEHTDLLIDGPFQQREMDFSRPWVGSKNQRYLFLSGRYNEADLWNSQYRNKYEVRIYPDGTVGINGMGDFSAFNEILDFKLKG